MKKWRSFCSNKGAVAGLVLLLLMTMVALFAPILAPHRAEQIFAESYGLPPFWEAGSDHRFILGTDDIGRDVLSRLIFGTRVSLGVGFVVVTLTLILGTLLGLLAGYAGGWVDAVILRFVDILMSLPSILLAIVVVAVLGPGLSNAVIAVSIISLPNFVRIVRAGVMAELAKPYIDASVGFGASHSRVAFQHLLPNCMAPIIVQASLGFSDGILNVAALGFLGLGAQPPTPEWGLMLADSRAFVESAWWLVTLPGLCILVAVLAFNIMGDGLRDALDPKLR